MYPLFISILFLILIHKIYSYEINLEERFDFYSDFYINNGLLFTPFTTYNRKYYHEDKYIYVNLPINNNSCSNTCTESILKTIDKNTVALIGFDIKMDNNSNNINICECKGSSLKVNKFNYYPFVSNITNYNPNYHELGEKIYVTDKVSFTFKSNCFENLMKKLKSLNVEAYNNYQIDCDENYKECNCSANILYLKP
jgi:hypothetical protein